MRCLKTSRGKTILTGFKVIGLLLLGAALWITIDWFFSELQSLINETMKGRKKR